MNPIYRQIGQVLAVGLGLGLFIAPAACSSSDDAAAAAAKSKSKSNAAVVVSGLYVATSQGGSIGYIDLEDATHYQLGKPVASASGPPTYEYEFGVYTLGADDTLTLTDDATKVSRSFTLKVIETRGGGTAAAGDNDSLLKTQTLVSGGGGGAGAPLVDESQPLLSATRITLLEGDGGTPQDFSTAMDTMGGKLQKVPCSQSVGGSARTWCWKLVS